MELKLLVGGLALSKFRGASRHAIDSICITAFISLTMTAIYSNYFLIHGAVISLSGILCNASVGNSIATDSREKTYRDMRRFNFMYMLAAGWTMNCLLCLYQPFVRLWVGPSLMLGMPEVVALCLYFYLLKAGDMRWIYHQGAGLWWKARYIVIAEIVCNVVLNILLAKYFGVLGIILATLISLFFVNFLGGAWILFKEYFKNGKLHELFADQALYFGVTAVLAVVCFWACDGVSAWMSVLLSGGSGVANSATMTSSAVGAATGSAATTGVVLASESATTAVKNGAAAATSVAGSVSNVAVVAQSKLLGVAGLVVRFLLCTFVSITGYFMVYRRSTQYQDAKEWLQRRYSLLSEIHK